MTRHCNNWTVRFRCGGRVVGTTYDLAINGDALPAQTTRELIDPTMHGGEELRRVESGKHAT